MFRLYEPAFEAALEDWGKLSRMLQVEKENQQMIMNTMSQAWVGKTQQDFENICKDLVTTGLYQQTSEIVERVYRIQYDLLPKIVAQMARCEKLPEQLEQDDYIPPYLSGYGYYNDGLLALDEDYVESCNNAAEEAVVQATEMRNLLYRAMDACDGLIDFDAEREELESGYRKVKRIEHFQIEFNKYVTEVKEIEEELITGFRTVMANDPDPESLKWKAVLQNLNTKRSSLHTMQQLSSVNLSAGVSSYPEGMHILTVNLLLKELFCKKISTVTKSEQRFLADTFAQMQQLFSTKNKEILYEVSEVINPYLESFYEFQYNVEGILEKINPTEWITLVRNGLTDVQKEAGEFLDVLETIPGENVYETIENLDELSGRRLKESIYHAMKFVADADIKEKVETIYGLAPEWWRPLQKTVVNNVLSEVPSELEGYVINSLLAPITKGLLGFNYNEEKDSYYTSEGSLQNAWGFGAAIDEFAPLLGMDLYHKDIVFELDNKEYLIEFWKGEYGWGITSGGEVGIYTRPIEDARANPYIKGENNFDIFYDCAAEEDQLIISTVMYEKVNEKGDLREICSKSTADNVENPKDYWNLNFRSFDAVDKEDIRMHIEIQGDPAVLQLVEAYINDPENKKDMENLTVISCIEKNDIGVIEIMWEAGKESGDSNIN